MQHFRHVKLVVICKMQFLNVDCSAKYDLCLLEVLIEDLVIQNRLFGGGAHLPPKLCLLVLRDFVEQVNAGN